MFCQFVTGRHFAQCAQCLNRNQIMEENRNIEETVETKDRESQQAGTAEGKAGAEAKDGQENRKRKSRKEEKKEDEDSVKEDIQIVKAGYNLLSEKDRKRYIQELTREMTDMAKRLEFEKAAIIRDEIERIKSGKDLAQ